jgi:tryptophanyl-tRNA synthetase
MSKSHHDPRSRILVTDSPEEIDRKIRAALTDSMNSVSYSPTDRPGVANLLKLLSYFDIQGRSAAELGKVHKDLSLGSFKSVVSETISSSLQGVRERYIRVMEEDEGRYLKHIEAEGARKACESANATMAKVKNAVGL